MKSTNDREFCCFKISCKMLAYIDTVVNQLIKLLNKRTEVSQYISVYVALQTLFIPSTRK